MTLFWSLVAATLVAAAVDWWAVAGDRRRLELLFKPLTLLLLIAAAWALPQPLSEQARDWMLLALICSLLGDVLLMADERYFVAGLGAFLAAHLLYGIGLAQFDMAPAALGPALLLVAAAGWLVGRRILAGAAAQSPRLRWPVALYMLAISAMLVMAFATGLWAAVAGALLFYASDSLLGWNRFVRPLPHGRLGLMVCYHLGQLGLVLALLG